MTRDEFRLAKQWKTYSCSVGDCLYHTEDREEYIRHAIGCQTLYLHYIRRKRERDRVAKREREQTLAALQRIERGEK